MTEKLTYGINDRVVGIFQDLVAAESAISELYEAGFTWNEVSILLRDPIDLQNPSPEPGGIVITFLPDRAGTMAMPLAGGASKYPPSRAKERERVETTRAEVRHRDVMLKGNVGAGAPGLLGELTVLTIPGMGPVIVAGPIWTAVTAAAGHAAIGATADTLNGIFENTGIPGDRFGFYRSCFGKGNAIIMVHTREHHARRAWKVLARHTPDTLDSF